MLAAVRRRRNCGRIPRYRRTPAARGRSRDGRQLARAFEASRQRGSEPDRQQTSQGRPCASAHASPRRDHAARRPQSPSSNSPSLSPVPKRSGTDGETRVQFRPTATGDHATALVHLFGKWRNTRRNQPVSRRFTHQHEEGSLRAGDEVAGKPGARHAAAFCATNSEGSRPSRRSRPTTRRLRS